MAKAGFNTAGAQTGREKTTAEKSFSGAATRAIPRGIHGLPVRLAAKVIRPIANPIMIFPG
jgi:hypothetical protein